MTDTQKSPLTAGTGAGGGREADTDLGGSVNEYSTGASAFQEKRASRLADAVVALPSTNGHGGDSRNSHENPRGSRFRLLRADELDDLPPLRWLVPGEIPAESLGVVYGPTGSGKSFVVLDYAMGIAQHSPVVYIAAEGAHGYAARKLAWCKHHGKTAGQLYFIADAPNLLDAGQVADLVATVAEVRPVLIVVDTLARTMVGGDENTQRDMGMFVAACDAIRRVTDGTVLVVHHTGRNGNHERGSTVLRGAADQVIGLENDDGLIRLSCEKSKDSSGFPTRAVRLVTIETGRLKEDGAPETSCIVLPSDQVVIAGTLTTTGRELLKTLALDVHQRAGARAKTLIDSTQLKPSTFYRTISQLVKEKLVYQDAKGDPFTITAEGLKLLAVK